MPRTTRKLTEKCVTQSVEHLVSGKEMMSWSMTTLAGGFLVTNHYDAGRKVSKSNLDRGRKQKRPLR